MLGPLQLTLGLPIVGIEYRYFGAMVNTRFRFSVGRDISVTIHMIFADIQYRRCRRRKAMRGFQLEAGQLQHIKIRFRFTEQIKRRCTEVAANQRALVSVIEQMRGQRRDCRFAVRAGNSNDRRPCFAHEQFDIADDFDTSCACLMQRLVTKRNTRRQNDACRLAA